VYTCKLLHELLLALLVLLLLLLLLLTDCILNMLFMRNSLSES
jgi:hypothetical protein